MDCTKFRLVKELWQDIACDKFPENEIEDQLKSLRHDHFYTGKSFYTVFTPGKLIMDFCSSTIHACLGYRPENINSEFFWSCIHPSDLQGILEFEKRKNSFYKSLSPDQITDYKIRYSFRMKNVDGVYFRLLYQSLPLEVDNNGSVLRVIAFFTDITYLKSDTDMNLSFISLGNQPDILNVQRFNPSSNRNSPFTKRETEVLANLAKGFTNHEIADKLNISSVTVSNHRKRMLRKTKAGSTLNLILLAQENRWI